MNDETIRNIMCQVMSNTLTKYLINLLYCNFSVQLVVTGRMKTTTAGQSLSRQELTSFDVSAERFVFCACVVTENSVVTELAKGKTLS